MDDGAITENERSRHTDVERFVYGGVLGKRFTQRSPIMLDVWSRFALEGPGAQDLLLIANRDSTADALARDLAARLRADVPAGARAVAAEAVSDVAGLVATQAAVAARLTFPQLVRAALPMTHWWGEYLCEAPARDKDDPIDPAVLFAGNAAAAALRQAMIDALDGKAAPPLREDLLWLARVAGGIAHLHALVQGGTPTDAQWQQWLEDRERGAIVVGALFALLRDVKPDAGAHPLWAIHSNRAAEMALRRSMSTIKADAARQVFDVTGKGICWAVIDSGIDATHVAFRCREQGKPVKLPYPEPGEPACAAGPAQDIPPSWTKRTRIAETYDFTNVRELMALTPRQIDRYPEGVPEVLRDRLADPDYRARVHAVLAATTRNGHGEVRRVIDWEPWRPLLRIEHIVGRYRKPVNPHGTHVAGILAADWRVDDLAKDAVVLEGDTPARQLARTGVCPELELWDIRVLDAAGKSDELSILAALQFVRWVNAQHEYQEIHGVNLSFSLLHKVESYACGGTPVCVECERLVAAGIVVVAAAGNLGRARYIGSTGEVDDGYRVASITDPGNALGVITVGATHRFEPHSYGVSYFSSRGPTGDGRAKPDLVAPGEKIVSTAPGNKELSLDGTSAAAPHVSGAAALLLCRYSELRGRPAEIKRILCATATDLGRDRYWQGAGLVDILRAMESI
jgi:serine protease AprX